jgi:hypothetical protein
MKALIEFALSTTLAVFGANPVLAQNACCAATINGVYPPSQLSDADIAAMAPVQSVNTQTGQVIVQTFQRAVGTLSNFTSVSGYTQGVWSYTTKVNGVDTPFAFAAPPRCFMQIKSASPSVTFTYPVITSVTATAVTFRFAAQPLSINLAALGNLSLIATTPADTTVDILCLNPI